MLEYNFILKYRPGKSNTAADFLSRNALVSSLEKEAEPLSLRQLQQEDERLKDVITFLENGELPQREKGYVKFVRQLGQECFIENGWVPVEETESTRIQSADRPMRSTQISEEARLRRTRTAGGRPRRQGSHLK